MLTLSNVTKKFGELTAVDDLSFTVEKGSIFGIAGPNGAGKSTVYNLITGYYSYQGRIEFNGKNISGRPPYRIAKDGIARTFQIPQTFPSLNVRKCISVGSRFGSRKGLNKKKVKEILRFVGLEDEQETMTGRLNLLSKKKLMIGAALATEPKILMLDEPMAGCNAMEIRSLMDLIRNINSHMGVTIIIIEHFMKVLTELTELLLIIESGSKICLEEPEIVVNKPEVIDCYLGALMLKVTDLNAYYGESHVLHDISISVKQGEVVVMLGPNGHGKSTLLRSICGLVSGIKGEIVYRDKKINRLSTMHIVNLGLIYIAENRELFPYLTVLENLKLGAYSKNARAHEKENLEKVFALFPRLVERKSQLANTMSGGEAKMLAVARGLMSNADFLCIDEPSLGLQPSLRHEIFTTIKQINEQGKTVFLVEQNIPQIAELADRVYVMEEGRISFEGSKDEALDNEHLKEIFLGM